MFFRAGLRRLLPRSLDAPPLGILPVVVLPVILVLVVPAALLLAVAVAAVPGESAARTRPAEILRSA